MQGLFFVFTGGKLLPTTKHLLNNSNQSNIAKKQTDTRRSKSTRLVQSKSIKLFFLPFFCCSLLTLLSDYPGWICPHRLTHLFWSWWRPLSNKHLPPPQVPFLLLTEESAQIASPHPTLVDWIRDMRLNNADMTKIFKLDSSWQTPRPPYWIVVSWTKTTRGPGPWPSHWIYDETTSFEASGSGSG